MNVYYCPTAGDIEAHPDGGFDTCCNHPELHRPVQWTDLYGTDPNYTKEEPTEAARLEQAQTKIDCLIDLLQKRTANGFEETLNGYIISYLQHWPGDQRGQPEVR